MLGIGLTSTTELLFSLYSVVRNRRIPQVYLSVGPSVAWACNNCNATLRRGQKSRSRAVTETKIARNSLIVQMGGTRFECGCRLGPTVIGCVCVLYGFVCRHVVLTLVACFGGIWQGPFFTPLSFLLPRNILSNLAKGFGGSTVSSLRRKTLAATRHVPWALNRGLHQKIGAFFRSFLFPLK